MESVLPPATSVLAVCAHPDDESFGLGAILDAYSKAGTEVGVLCFTPGEASTLGEGDLATLRGEELMKAAAVLGVGHVSLLDYPDGRLASCGIDELAAHVRRTATDARADILIVFDEGGITGHPDHERATEAALRAAPGCGSRVLAWAVGEEAARALNREFGTTFTGRADDELNFKLEVDRSAQSRAIECHRSQSATNPVLRRRLELCGSVERLRWLHT